MVNKERHITNETFPLLQKSQTFTKNWLFGRILKHLFSFNPFVPKTLFLYTLKTSKTRFSDVFKELEKGCIGSESVKKLLILKRSVSNYASTSVKIGVLGCNVAEYKSILLWFSIEVEVPCVRRKTKTIKEISWVH